MKNITKEQAKKFTPEILVAVISTAASLLMAWYVYTQHLMTTLADQAAHLVFSRLLIDSMTPGISQLGTWPPLLHILMMPAVSIRPLFETGLAGVVTLLPFFVLGAVFLYRLAYQLTKDKVLSFTAVLIYIFNPYVLYYAVTPMMEILFLTMLIAVAYYLVLWLDSNRLRYLILAGIFVALASVSRFEGIFIIPVAVIIVFVQLVLRRLRYREIEATLIIFGSLALLGFGYLIVYNWIFAGNPLSFAGVGGGMKWAVGGGDLALLESRNNIFSALQYVIHASYYMFGKPMVAISLVSAVLVVIFSKDRLRIVAAFSLLFVPFVAVLFALYHGSNSIHVPELIPFDRFHNDRYAISWIGMLILSPIILLSSFKRMRFGFINLLFLTALCIFSGLHFCNEVFVKNFSVIKDNVSATTREESIDFIEPLQDSYDYGKILAIRFNNDFFFIDSHLPLKTFIYEGNYKYFNQALSMPWLYARLVVMQNPDSISAKSYRDPIKDKWSNNSQFQHYYSVITVDNRYITYKIKNEKVIEYANENNLNTNRIPSLNPLITDWSPDAIYQEMKMD